MRSSSAFVGVSQWKSENLFAADVWSYLFPFPFSCPYDVTIADCYFNLVDTRGGGSQTMDRVLSLLNSRGEKTNKQGRPTIV